MTTVHLMNSAMMPQEGQYRLKAITASELREILRNSDVISYIGYAATAEHIHKVTGVRAPISRQETQLLDGDRMVIVRLKYRIADPRTKGQFTPGDDDYEYFSCVYHRA